MSYRTIWVGGWVGGWALLPELFPEEDLLRHGMPVGGWVGGLGWAGLSGFRWEDWWFE